MRKNYGVELLSVAEAAQRLGRSQARVRQLARSGALPGRRVSGVWLVDAAAVDERAAAAPEPGRPLTPGYAWQVVSTVSVLGVAEAAMSSWHELLPGGGDRRVRRRLAANLRRAPGVDGWPGWLASRAVTRRYSVDHAALYRLLGDGRVSLGGAHGLVASGVLAAQSSEVVDVYVRHDVADAVIAAWRLDAEAAGTVRLRVVPAAVSGAGPVAGRPAPEAASLVDLLESPDPALRDTAARRLQHLIDELHRLRDGPAP